MVRHLRNFVVCIDSPVKQSHLHSHSILQKFLYSENQGLRITLVTPG
jgi:hypothetical protein